MWNEINSMEDINHFMEMMCCFHDSCIKEMKYISGAYVGDSLAMYPVNDRTILSLVIQRQFKDYSMIEMEFHGLKYLKLFPVAKDYTCEILGATMTMKDDYIYWCDCDDINILEEDIENYGGTVICAFKMRWRDIKGHMGEEEFYVSKEN